MKSSIIEIMIKDWNDLLNRYIKENDYNNIGICRYNIDKLTKELGE